MTMLHADSAEFRERYPNYARVFDAWGRRIRHVLCCNPETGEVIRYESAGGGCVWRHGFWPAPLRVVAKEPKFLWPGCDPEHAAMIGRTALRLAEEDAARRHALTELVGDFANLTETYEELGAAIAAHPWPGGSAPDGEAYIVGNGDREVLMEPEV